MAEVYVDSPSRVLIDLVFPDGSFQVILSRPLQVGDEVEYAHVRWWVERVLLPAYPLLSPFHSRVWLSGFKVDVDEPAPD
ncbi:MAG TPA: hypothetical protein VGE74_23795 [Gemmata sp.]